jgi:hypothetical protein
MTTADPLSQLIRQAHDGSSGRGARSWDALVDAARAKGYRFTRQWLIDLANGARKAPDYSQLLAVAAAIDEDPAVVVEHARRQYPHAYPPPTAERSPGAEPSPEAAAARALVDGMDDPALRRAALGILRATSRELRKLS